MKRTAAQLIDELKAEAHPGDCACLVVNHGDHDEAIWADEDAQSAIAKLDALMCDGGIPFGFVRHGARGCCFRPRKDFVGSATLMLHLAKLTLRAIENAVSEGRGLRQQNARPTLTLVREPARDNRKEREMGNITDGLQRMHDFFAIQQPGPLDKKPVAAVIEPIWHSLPGSAETRMSAYKLARMYDVQWDPPRLYFKMVRHGGMQYGSTRGEVQRWTVNVEAEWVSVEPIGYSQVIERDSPLKTGPIAGEIVAAVLAATPDPGYQWKPDGTLQISVGKSIPKGSPKRTIETRQKWLSGDVRKRLEAAGYKWLRANQYERPTASE